MSLQWTEDTLALSKCAKFNVRVKNETIAVSDIDWTASLHNQARIAKPLKPELVEQYALAMERGDAFPKIVVARHNRKYIILGGNHRGKAVDLYGETEIPVHLIETDDEKILDLLPRTLNCGLGDQTSREDALLHALHFVDHYGYPAAKAAELMGLRDNYVNASIRARSVANLLDSHNIRSNAIGKGSLEALASVDNDNVKLVFGRLIVERGYNTELIREYLKNIKKARTEATQMAAVAEIEQSTQHLRPSSRAVGELSGRTKVFAKITTMENFLDGKNTLQQLGVTDEAGISEAVQRLKKLAKAIKSIVDATADRQTVRSRRTA